MDAPSQTLRCHVVELGGPTDPDRAVRNLEQVLDRLPAVSRGELVRLEQPVRDLDPLPWLAAGRDAVRLYWHDRSEDFCLAGRGVALALDGRHCADLIATLDDPRPRLLTSIRFHVDGVAGELWRPFGRIRCVLPRLEVRRTGSDLRLACHLAPTRDGDLARARAALRDAARQIHPPAPPRLTGDRQSDAPGWGRAVTATLDAIAAGRLQKAVLARAAVLYAERPPCPIGILQRLETVHAGTFRFCVQPAAGIALVGASPELLYRRRGEGVASEALAGTRPRGRDAEHDAALAAELRQSAKDRREQGFVHSHIEERLRPLCRELRCEGEPQIHALANVQHLRTQFRGRLQPGVGDAEILHQLHPTPAVCGLPVATAFEHIDACEGFDRGLYGGAIGCLGREHADFAVAIRCGLLRGKELRLYAGAGIVEGSVAVEEWRETVAKMATFTAVL